MGFYFRSLAPSLGKSTCSLRPPGVSGWVPFHDSLGEGRRRADERRGGCGLRAWTPGSRRSRLRLRAAPPGPSRPPHARGTRAGWKDGPRRGGSRAPLTSPCEPAAGRARRTRARSGARGGAARRRAPRPPPACPAAAERPARSGQRAESMGRTSERNPRRPGAAAARSTGKACAARAPRAGLRGGGRRAAPRAERGVRGRCGGLAAGLRLALLSVRPALPAFLAGADWRVLPSLPRSARTTCGRARSCSSFLESRRLAGGHRAAGTPPARVLRRNPFPRSRSSEDSFVPSGVTINTWLQRRPFGAARPFRDVLGGSSLANPAPRAAFRGRRGSARPFLKVGVKGGGPSVGRTTERKHPSGT